MRWRSTMHNPDRPFCSKACVGLAKRNGCDVDCVACGKVFYRHYAEQELSIRNNQFCSVTCYQEWRGDNRKPDTYPKIGGVHEHRIVAEKALGRPLIEGEIVHHIDGNKHNNHRSNLAVLPSQEIHVKVHFGKVSDEELLRFSL